MNEKWRLPFWAAAAAKYMEFAATQRSASFFVEEDLVFFYKLSPAGIAPAGLLRCVGENLYPLPRSKMPICISSKGLP